MRSEEGVFSGCEYNCIKTMYGFELQLDFLPPAIVLVYFLKRVCKVDGQFDLCRGCGGELVINLATYVILLAILSKLCVQTYLGRNEMFKFADTDIL